MGRTYKRNDPHNSRKPKSIREKRQWNKQTTHKPIYQDDPHLSAPHEEGMTNE